ncbi:MAG: peroxide stress protein YaaA [Atopobiaceae bacterium]|jgi:cytoplasmic iron level regulating protein YaaA (DUF328/UPF0246 family)|nr:peroxide stress protein YaaA [Atopobiaceae bacterium]
MSLCLVISPAKKMNEVEGPPLPAGTPALLDRTRVLMQAVRRLGYAEARELWHCSDALARLNFDRFRDMDLQRAPTAAVMSYEGIQYRHLSPAVMSEPELAYLAAHLRILSGFYGVLRPFDGVVPYRLEMQAKLAVDGSHDLYGFWGTALYEALAAEFDAIVNLASREYARAVAPCARQGGPAILTCLFGELREGRLVQRATEAKAARGTFVRWCAERGVEEARDMAGFGERGYSLDEDLSDEKALVFTRDATRGASRGRTRAG